MGIPYRRPVLGGLRRWKIGPFFIARSDEYEREIQNARGLLCDGVVFGVTEVNGERVPPPDPKMLKYWHDAVTESLWYDDKTE